MRVEIKSNEKSEWLNAQQFIEGSLVICREKWEGHVFLVGEEKLYSLSGSARIGKTGTLTFRQLLPGEQVVITQK